METTREPYLSSVASDNGQGMTNDRDMTRLELVSAFFDGEFDSSQKVLNPASHSDLDPLEHKQDWALYALIADSLSQPSGRALMPSADFSARLSAALEREPAHVLVTNPAVSAARAPNKASVWPRWLAWPSLAVAAAVAAVVWVAQPLLMVDEPVVVAIPEQVDQQPTAITVVADYANAHRHFSGPIAVRQASFEPGAER
jgi:negative regulator of sigma E activity